MSSGCAADIGEGEGDTDEYAVENGYEVHMPVFSLATFQPIPRTDAELERNRYGHEVEELTRGLPAGHVVALFYIAFNAPENCTNPIPGLSACSVPDSQNLATEPTLMWADGTLTGRDGVGYFDSFIGFGTDGAPGELLFGPGLIDNRGAEVHYLTRDKGVPVRGRVWEQMSTFYGACDVATCQDLQFAIFPATR